MTPTLLAVAHGTRNEAGLRANQDLIETVRTMVPGVDVRLCWLDIASPTLPDALAAISGPVVLVPVLLSTGYHVKVDIPAAVAGRDDAVVAPHLGPDPLVLEAVAERLETALARSSGREDQLVTGSPGVSLVSAGSSDPAAREELAAAAATLARRLGRPVAFAQLSEAELPPADAVANYLLAPGFFDDQLRKRSPGAVVADTLGAHPLVARAIADRYEHAVRAL